MGRQFPEYAIFRGKRVRVMEYEGDGKFRILESDDSQRTVSRDRLQFVPDKKEKKQ